MKRLLHPSLAIAAAIAALGAMTPAAPAQRIVVLTDVHVSPGNENSARLAEAVSEINASVCDAVVIDGDLTNEGSDAELRHVKGILDALTPPAYTIPGNHENNWSQSAGHTFPALWGDDRFAATVGSLAIVGTNCGPYMKMGDGHVKQEDLHWLRHALDSLSGGERAVVSFNHYPLRKDDLDNYAAYVATLADYPVILHVNGHYHAWDRYRTGPVEAVTARALSLDGTWGYTIIDIDSLQITVYEKLIGAEPTPKYTIPVKKRAPIEYSDSGAGQPLPSKKDLTQWPDTYWSDSASVFTRLAFDDRHVYFGTSTGRARAVSKSDGRETWSVQLPGALYSRPVVLPGGRVAFPHSRGIAVLSADDGRTLQATAGGGAPYVADGLLTGDRYIQGGMGRLECRDAADMTLIWSYDSIDNYCQGAPAVDGDDLVFGAWDTYLRCLSLADGRLKWQWSNGKSANLLGPGNVVPVITPRLVVIVAPDRYMTAIDRATGATVWRDNSHRYRESLGSSADGSTVYAKTMDGELVAVDVTGDTFRELWTCDMGLGYDHAPCIVAEKDGAAYAGSRRGIVTKVDTGKHRVLRRMQAGTSEVNGIDRDPTDGSLWISLVEGVVCRLP